MKGATSMISCRHAAPTDYTNVQNALQSQLIAIAADVSANLKIDNTIIIAPATTTDQSHITGTNNNIPMGIATYGGTRCCYYGFVNDFSSFNCGLLFEQYNSSKSADYVGVARTYVVYPTYEADPVNTYDSWPNIQMVIAGNDKTIKQMIDNPYFIYNGDKLALYAQGSLRTGFLFVKMKSLDDPTDIKPIIFNFGCGGPANSSYGVCSQINVLDNSGMQVTQYDDYINRTITDGDDIYIEKFIYNGYYCDELFIFNGQCPAGLFKLGNDTYLNVGFNLYIKIV